MTMTKKKEMSVGYPLLQISISQMQQIINETAKKGMKDFYGVPMYIAFDANHQVYTWPYSYRLQPNTDEVAK